MHEPFTLQLLLLFESFTLTEALNGSIKTCSSNLLSSSSGVTSPSICSKSINKDILSLGFTRLLVYDVRPIREQKKNVVILELNRRSTGGGVGAEFRFQLNHCGTCMTHAPFFLQLLLLSCGVADALSGSTNICSSSRGSSSSAVMSSMTSRKSIRNSPCMPLAIEALSAPKDTC